MVAVGLCARLIAQRIGLPEIEDVFLAGLLHDIGIVLEDQYAHQHFCKIVRSVAADRSLVEQERDYLAFDHTTLGGRVAELWKFPQGVLNAIHYHHASSSYEEDDKMVVRCVELANVICTSKGYSSVGQNLLRATRIAELAIPLPEDGVASLAEELRNELQKSASLFEL